MKKYPEMFKLLCSEINEQVTELKINNKLEKKLNTILTQSFADYSIGQIRSEQKEEGFSNV